MTEFGEGSFVFKAEAIIPKHPRAFLSALENFLKEHDAVISERDVEIPAWVEIMTEEEIAAKLYDESIRMQNTTEFEGSVREYVQSKPYFKQLLICARHLVQDD